MSLNIAYPLIIVAGIMQAFGGAMNTQLRNSLLSPYLAGIVTLAPMLVFFAFAVAFCRPTPQLIALGEMPWWAVLGGVAGLLALYLGLTLTDKIGMAPFNGLIITANIVASLIIDHYGWLRMPCHSLSPTKIAGAAFMVLGVVLISKI